MSNKMKAFYDNDFKTLISELKKKKIKLSFSQQDELQKKFYKTDKEINQMVYELYGLTKEESEIVENG